MPKGSAQRKQGETGVHGILLASGQSARMGKESKLLLPWQGLPLVEHLLLKTVGMPFDELKVVIPGDSLPLRQLVASYGCQPVFNKAPQLGIGPSLALAFSSLPASAEAALVLLGDQPTVQSKDISSVLKAFNDKRLKLGHCPKMIIQSKYREGRSGHPTLFSKHFFSTNVLINRRCWWERNH